MNCTASSLLSGAKGFRGIPKPLSRVISIFLLCRWANAAETPGALTVTWAGSPISTEQYLFSFAGSYAWDGEKYVQTPAEAHDACYIQSGDGVYYMYGPNGIPYYSSITITGEWSYMPEGGEPNPTVSV